MKTTVNMFADYKSIDARGLALPRVVTIDSETYEQFRHGETIEVCPDVLYFDRWVTPGGVIVPDFARVEKSKHGFYLDETQAMIETRDNTYQCGFCFQQYKKLITPFCIACLHREDLTEDNLYLLFLRPICTHDIEPSKRAIFVPPWLLHLYRYMQRPHVCSIA
jgi:hypothetical protein